MKRISTLATVLLLGVTSTISYAAPTSSCATDVQQMRQQIRAYGSITSHDGYRFHSVINPVKVSNSVCSAEGYYINNFVCNMDWTVGDWGNTFHCA